MTTREPSPSPWTMPAWMENYRKLIQNTGGNSVEDLLNDHRCDPFSNLYRWTFIRCVRAQVNLLQLLNEADLIGPGDRL